jgi:hypothetical protein
MKILEILESMKNKKNIACFIWCSLLASFSLQPANGGIRLANMQQQQLNLAFAEKKNHWTFEEDQQLIRLIQRYGTEKWGFIAKYIPNRTASQCKERWFYFFSQPRRNEEGWTFEEDQKLIVLVGLFGPKWTQFTKIFPGRAGNNIKNRWNYYLSKNTNQQPNLSAAAHQSQGRQIEKPPVQGTEGQEISSNGDDYTFFSDENEYILW